MVHLGTGLFPANGMMGISDAKHLFQPEKALYLLD
jgi:hypothetical protein